MASTAGLPERPLASESTYRPETEPLLGIPGNGVLERANIVRKTVPFIGTLTGIIAEIGVLVLCCEIWARIASIPVVFFSGHPIAMSTAIFILTQSILFQQPITSENLDKKRRGQYVHAALNLVAFIAIVTGFTIVEVSKVQENRSHFPPSPHAAFGASTLLLLIVQYIIGFTMWMTPSLYGGEARAKSLYKYHRFSGYFILLMLLMTAVTAALTGYNKYVLGVRDWVASLGSFLVVIGLFSRVQKQKLGFGVSQQPQL